jgi:hypothetical protein
MFERNKECPVSSKILRASFGRIEFECTNGKKHGSAMRNGLRSRNSMPETVSDSSDCECAQAGRDLQHYGIV